MKIARVDADGEAVLAMQLTGQWLNISRAWQDYERLVEGVDAHSIRDMRELFQRGLAKRAACQKLLAFIEEAGSQRYVLERGPEFLLPFRPGKVIAIGRNYAAHVREFDNEMPQEPLFFGKLAETCIGPQEPIVVKEWYGRVDHEGEIGVVINQEVRDAHPDLAQALVAGYTLVNDVTAREMQKGDVGAAKPWFRSKNLDTFCPMGPAVLLPEDVPWPLELDIETRVNGEVRQQSNTRMFLFKLPEIIAYVSKHMTLYPGDVIATGTPEGVGPLKPGDVVEVSCPEIGVLRNPVQ
jgi:5-oxopent-3-ene-1,2,5-tricarboxylate decarboxylase / 2-hydroxyhepta-2,4-diene-1,7-dioate isomerase